MKHYSEITRELLEEVKPDFVYNYHQSYIANIPLAFDIETSSIEVEGEKFANMYVWAFGLADFVVYGRTWEEFKSLCELISDVWELSSNSRAIVYVHNLSYEFQFMRKWFNWEKVFSISERRPIKALTDLGIEFRDSYILSGFSLAKTAENLTSYQIKKLDGDLDYSLIRHSETDITDEEWGYIEHDILIIIYYIDEQITEYGSIARIPLTNTGRVRNYVKDRVFKTNGKRDNNKKMAYHDLMTQMVLTTDDYNQLKRAFMGGFTHANAMYSGKTLSNVHSIDFTSSYPSVMVSEMFPMSSPKPVNVNTILELETLMENYCVLFDVKFTNIESKITFENYISESKTRNLKGGITNNGRVFSADNLEMTITELDYHIIKQTYHYSKISVSNVKTMYRGYLPENIIKSVLELYQGKTELKGVEGKETEYLLSKGMLNSVYGMTVTDIAKDDYIYEFDEWSTEPINLDDNLTKHNKSKNRFLYYAWGVWITAYARFNLWTGILNFKEDYIYSDTDSIKFFNLEKHKPYINQYNQQLLIKQERVIKHFNLEPKLFRPKTIEGIEKPLGFWDYEGNYTLFKTLGAKRYLTFENGEFELTVAGLGKKDGLKYMKEQCETPKQMFDLFNDDLYIPKGRTGKQTHTYLDREQTKVITDYQGKAKRVTELSSIHLENADYTLNISDKYLHFLDRLTDGYLER